MEKFRVYGPSSPQESDKEIKHRALARKVAADGVVLLENNAVLPLKPQKIALYGAGERMTVKGGSDSGDVKERYSVSIEDGLKNAGFTFPNTLSLDRFENDFKIDAVVFYAQGGMEGGNTLADILTGKITPLGKLTGYEEASNAGNDIIMPGTGKVQKALSEALKNEILNKS